jgi:hypothetical protein
MLRRYRFALVSIGLILLGNFPSSAQTGLQVTYGDQGIQRVVYSGTVLEDLSQQPGDAFHIWHMKLTDLNGNPASCAQCGWGETNNGRVWNAVTHTWTYSYVWGSISVNFQQVGDTLNMNVTETNLPSSGYVLDGASIFPFVLNFPRLPSGFVDAAYPQYSLETTGPGVTTADWGSGEVVAVVTDASKPLYAGFQPTGTGFAYTPIVSGTTPDGIAVFLPHNDRPVQPGQTDSFTVSLRFAPSLTSSGSVAADAYQNWAKTWPQQLNWTDRRAIGTVYLASSPSGDPSKPGGFPNNPRRYFNDSSPDDFDVTTEAGLQRFQTRILQQASAVVTNLSTLNAQGAITWDIEGEQYPQATSYVCSPDQIAQVAPEMESTVSDIGSPFHGMKLDDAYFKTITNAGFRVGVCVRPQQFTLNADGTAQQVYLPDSAIAAQLIRKIGYAHSRWGATLFYIDSTVEANGGVLDATIFQQESTPKYYAYTAPFRTFIFHGDLGTDPAIYNYYPHAFSANLINDVAPATLAASLPALTASVQHGDILMGHADYAQANNPTILQIYQAAGGTSPTPVSTPAPTPPPALVSSPVTITSPANSSTVSGMALVTAQIGVALDDAGSYLMVDGVQYGSYRAGQAPYTYPLDTSTLPNGLHTLQIWAHDAANAVDLSQIVTVSVVNSAPSPPVVTSAPAIPPAPSPALAPIPNGLVVITSPGSSSIVSGTISVTAQVSVNLDAAGSYLMVDGAQFGTVRASAPPYNYQLDTTLLPNGNHTLQIWAHDTSNSVDLSPTLPIAVENSTLAATEPSGESLTPAPTSDNPVAITYPANGQAVSGTVAVSAMITKTLDAAGSHLIVDGAAVALTQVSAPPYVYSLDTGTLTPGIHLLQIWAHDTNNDILLSSPLNIITQ